MKIMPVFNFNLTQKIVGKSDVDSLRYKRNGLCCDTVSFKKSCPQLYRGITAEEELDSIFAGESGGSYATHNPMGWHGKFPGKYFITFKPEFSSKNVVYHDEDDKKYKLSNFYLNDIQDIRLGNKISGPVVYSSEMSEKEKQNFLNERIKNHIKEIKTGNDVDEHLACISHYLKDFVPMVTGAYGRLPDVEEIKSYDFQEIEKFLLNEVKPAFEKRESLNHIASTNDDYKGLHLRILIRLEACDVETALKELSAIKIEEKKKEAILSEKEKKGTIIAQEKGLLNTLRMLEKVDSGEWSHKYLQSLDYKNNEFEEDDDY